MLGLDGIDASRSQALEMSGRRLGLQAAEYFFFADQQTGRALIRRHEQRRGHAEVRQKPVDHRQQFGLSGL